MLLVARSRADVLLPGLEREAQCRAPGRVDRHANDAARQVALVVAAGRHERGVRPAVAQRDPEALRGADNHVGPLLPGDRKRSRARRSLATATRVPWACSASIRGRRSHTRPLLPGYWSTAANTPAAGTSRSGSPTTRWSPSGSAGSPGRRSSAGDSPRRRSTHRRPWSSPDDTGSSPRPRPSPRRAATRWPAPAGEVA